jgi:tetratricopeptide (TPR) repeat protein
MNLNNITVTIRDDTIKKTPSLCLNMIVKNESKIIYRMFDSVIKFIDSYCICDTGSTDNTKELIKAYFDEKNIPGKIIDEPFRDFGYNRTVALQACEGMPNADYILLLDADMILEYPNTNLSTDEIKQMMTDDVYYVYQGSPQFFYKNVRVVKNNLGCTYKAPTHEYVNTPPGTKYNTFQRDVLFINDVGDGGSKGDKVDRDIRLLLKGLEDEPDNDRYTFYLANSYKDKGDNETAIEYYKKRIALGGWMEEVWFSYYSLGKCYKRMNNNAMAIQSWLEGYNYYPNRIENLYEIIQHYRIEGKNNFAYHMYMLADYERKKNDKWDYLFLEKDVYDYRIDYELSIIGYYCNRDNHDLAKVCMKVLGNQGAADSICRNVFSNYKFYTKELAKFAVPMKESNMKILQSIGKDLLLPYIGEFASSTPTMCYNEKGNLVVGVRYVNYRIGEKGEYINQDHIETKNVIATIDVSMPEWKKLDEFVLQYDTTHDDLYVGLEDVRLMMGEGGMYYNANRGLGDWDQHKMVIEHGKINMQTKSTEPAIPDTPFLTYTKQTNIEKNWVLFPGTNSTQNAIYKWQPLTIGKITETQEFQTVSELESPNFFRYLRGSTNGVIVGDEIWFLTHLVSYEDRRWYYHCMVVLDRETHTLKKHSPLFTFEKKPVEYTLGFVHIQSNNRFLIGYSLMDKETKYMTISKHVFDDEMIGF